MKTEQSLLINIANTTQLKHRQEDFAVNLEEEITQAIIEYSHLALKNSLFFSSLKKNKPSKLALKYIFGQYRLWRDQFHTWFGLCILKSGSCENEQVQKAVLELADHVLIEMRENHDQIYRLFLHKIGLT